MPHYLALEDISNDDAVSFSWNVLMVLVFGMQSEFPFDRAEKSFSW